MACTFCRVRCERCSNAAALCPASSEKQQPCKVPSELSALTRTHHSIRLHAVDQTSPKRCATLRPSLMYTARKLILCCVQASADKLSVALPSLGQPCTHYPMVPGSHCIFLIFVFSALGSLQTVVHRQQAVELLTTY